MLSLGMFVKILQTETRLLKTCTNGNFSNSGKVFVFDNGPLWTHRSEVKIKLKNKFHEGAKIHDFRFTSVYGYDDDGICQFVCTKIDVYTNVNYSI